MPRKDRRMALVKGIAFTGLTAFLFYRAWQAVALGALFLPLFWKRQKKQADADRHGQLLLQFQSGIQAVSGALSAGYSMKNAWKLTQKEICKMYGEEAEFYCALEQINQKAAMNEPVDQTFYAWALTTEEEDIINFAEIFCYASRSGGNLKVIIRESAERLQEKKEILEDIETAVTAKRTEQKLMNLLMPGILLFVTVSSPEYVSVLYHSAVGVLVMSGCLAGYLISVSWSEKIVDIHV